MEMRRGGFMLIDKVLKNFDEAVADISDGATVGLSCFGGPAMSPQNLIRALARKGSKNLTLAVHAICFGEGQATAIWPPYIDHGLLVEKGMVKKLISSFPFWPGLETPISKEWKANRLEVEHIPHGTLQIRLWAGGAGVGGVYIKTGLGTEVETGKEKRMIHGEEYLLEMPIKLDFGLIRAYKADGLGNLIYNGCQRAAATMIARASNTTIAEVDEIVEVGELNPEHIVSPGIYVHRVLQMPKEV
jgi:3-oxoacid CoA-transferase A subunit